MQMMIDRDCTPLVEWALRYASLGWSIIPTKGKKPAIASWKRFQTERPTEADLRDMFGRSDVDGLAVILGDVSTGLACRDFDALQSYECWAKQNPILASVLPTVETKRGRHVYFRGPCGFQQFADGEYRGDSGHYCLVPQSRHPSGHIYRWLVGLPDGPLPLIEPMKVGLLSCNTENTDDIENTDDTENTENSDTQTTQTHPELSVLHAIESTLPTGTGQRSRKLFELARWLKAIPETATVDVSELRAVVNEWHRRALPTIRTKAFTDSWADFVHGWERVKQPTTLNIFSARLVRVRRRFHVRRGECDKPSYDRP